MDQPPAPGALRAGSLTDVALSDVLRSLASARETGILHLSGSFSSIVCLRDGAIYLAHAETGPSLRQLFLASGGIDEARWERSVEAARQGGSLVTALSSVGGASPERVRAALHEHTVSTLFELLVPNQNHFRFGAGEIHQIGTDFSFPVEDVLHAAGARLAEFTEIARSIPSTDVVMRVVPSLPVGIPQLTVSAVEWQVLAAVDGRATVADITATVGHGAFTVFSALHRLLRAGAVERVEHP